MSGCCGKCKVPFEWCGNKACACHAGAPARRPARSLEDELAEVEAELVRTGQIRRARR